MSFTLAKRRIIDVSLSNEREHKRSKVVIEKEANGVEREEEEELLWNCGLPTLSFEHSSTAITPSPSNLSSDTVIKYLQREDKEEKKEMYVWARYFFDDFTQNCDVSGSLVIYALMLEHCGNEPVPPEDIITKWMTEKHSDEHCSREISVAGATETVQLNATSEGGHCSKATGDYSFNEPTETTMLDDDCKDNDFSLQVEDSDCAVDSTEMIVESSKPRRKFVWARCYFDKLMEEEGRIDLSRTEIHNLMQQNCGNKSVPSLRCVSTWLSEKRKEVGRGTAKNFAWSRCYFDRLMEDKGCTALSNTEIHNLMQQNCGNKSVPSLACVSRWILVKHEEVEEEVGEVGKRYKSKKFAWARCYFNKLMEEEGHIDLSNTEICDLMQQHCGNKSVPSLACVSTWLWAKRKEVGEVGKSQEKQFAWARCYFDKLMEEEGRIDSSKTEIHNLMRQNCGIESLPSLACVNTWLWVKRKELGEVGKSYKSKKYAWALCYFDKLMKEEGLIDFSNTEIRNLMQQNCGNKSVPSLTCVSRWLLAKRKEVGEVGKRYKSKKFAWARCYFDKLMEEEGRINLYYTEIYNLMQQNCGNESVPSLASVSGWLRDKRKEVGEVGNSREQKVRGDFDKLIEEEGRIDSTCTEIESVPSLRTTMVADSKVAGGSRSGD